jgi:CspA family cold shock protein
VSKGTVKRVIRERGLGFILAEDGSEIFFHRSELQNVVFDELQEGNHLEFSVVKGKRGPRATGIRKTEPIEGSISLHLV